MRRIPFFSRIDFAPVFLLLVLAFAAVGSLQFAQSLHGAEHGIFLFEKACPIYHSAR
jgi:hypothetical protein